MEPTDRPALAQVRSGSQTRIPQALLWIAAAAVVLRIVTVFADRPRPDGGAGLVSWQPAASAVSLSQKDRKPILYDFTAAWCAPCHKLDAEAWNDAAIAKRVGDRFVPARVVDREREDGKNTADIDDLQRRFHVSAFPTLVIADASGREISRMEGYGGRERLEEFLADALRKAATP